MCLRRLDAPFGTEDNPVVVPSEHTERIVGVADPDDDSLVRQEGGGALGGRQWEGGVEDIRARPELDHAVLFPRDRPPAAFPLAAGVVGRD